MLIRFIKAVFIAAFILYPALLYGNPYTGTLTGIVIDGESNKPIPNAEVEIIEKRIFTTTNSEGFFSFKNLLQGEYLIKVKHIAYKEALVKIRFDENSKSSFVIYMLPKTIEISTVIVSDRASVSKFDDLQELANVLKGKELQKDLGLTLASTLKNETGLAIRSMGPAPARPVIRGLGGDRVLISEDGSKTSDLSATSPDHAVTVEPFSVDRIEVMRGPKILLHTPITIGGVVNVVRHDIPHQIHNRPFGTLGGFYESANGGYLGSLTAEVPISKFAVRIEASRKKSLDLKTPAGTLKNSGSENSNYSFGSAYINDFGRTGFSVRRFVLDYGIPGGFIGAHPYGVNISLYRNQFNFLTDYKFGNSIFENLELKYAASLYRHKEFERSGRIGSEFRILTHSGSLLLNHKKLSFFDEGSFGISGEFRNFEIGGFVFTSPTKSYNVALFGFESFNLKNFSFEASARFNYDRIVPEREKPNTKIGFVRKRDFSTYSISVSGLYEVSKIVHIGANFSKSSRVPTIEELFSEGPHLAAYSYETGNPNLEAESGIGSEIFIYHKFPQLYYNINFFYNRINNYIIPRNTGQINYATFLPIYSTAGVPAVLYGFEAQLDWQFIAGFSIDLSVSYTRGMFKDTGNSLPQIPPLRGIAGLKFEEDNFNCGITTEFAASQNYVDTFEESTKGYILFHTYAQYSFSTGAGIHTISVNLENIFNREYRNHLSRVKSILPEAGINARATYKLFFHL